VRKIRTLTTAHLLFNLSLHVTYYSSLFLHLFQTFLHLLQLLRSTEQEQRTERRLEPSIRIEQISKTEVIVWTLFASRSIQK
jgi:hypothetical protein